MKLSNLKITDRGWHLVVHASKSGVLHISRQNGNDGNYAITSCGKALKYYLIFDDIGYIRREYCPRCGKKEDFEAALNEYKEKIAQVNEELERIWEAEREAALIRVAETAQALSEFSVSLRDDGYEVSMIEDHRIVVMRNGRRFEIIGGEQWDIF